MCEVPSAEDYIFIMGALMVIVVSLMPPRAWRLCAWSMLQVVAQGDGTRMKLDPFNPDGTSR
jgi:hypothetical protein